MLYLVFQHILLWMDIELEETIGGTYLLISTGLYIYYREKIQIIPNITGSGSED
jgi:hypothetical protein